ncbi:hypothetical protein Scep_007211 [Stephania cephalantha]|uniref:Uncharacterized protein n=1 Tax=Stephania cephalantha TaxID=152367 RepID=A0AAP0KB42_9MAGN
MEQHVIKRAHNVMAEEVEEDNLGYVSTDITMKSRLPHSEIEILVIYGLVKAPRRSLDIQTLTKEIISTNNSEITAAKRLIASATRGTYNSLLHIIVLGFLRRTDVGPTRYENATWYICFIGNPTKFLNLQDKVWNEFGADLKPLCIWTALQGVMPEDWTAPEMNGRRNSDAPDTGRIVRTSSTSNGARRHLLSQLGGQIVKQTFLDLIADGELGNGENVGVLSQHDNYSKKRSMGKTESTWA